MNKEPFKTEQAGQRLSMKIGNQIIWVEKRPDKNQPNPYNGLNYFIYSSPKAQLCFMGASTWAAFVSDISRIASGVLDEMINDNRKHYEQ